MALSSATVECHFSSLYSWTGVLTAHLPNFSRGQISALTGVDDDPKMFQISTPLQPGNSGGALLTESGDVAGIVCGSLNAIEMARLIGTLPQNVDYAIKSEQLASLMREIPQLHDFGFKTQASTFPYEQVIASRMLQCPSTLKKSPLLEFALRRLASGGWLDRVVFCAIWPIGKAETALVVLQDHFAAFIRAR